MMNFFGKKKAPAPSTVSATSAAPRASDPQSTIVNLRQQITNQEKREEHIIKKVEMMTDEAKKKLAKGDKTGAVFSMKKKKMYEGELDKISNVKMTLETQVMNLESAAQNIETVKAMKQGTTTMQKIRTDIGIDDVDNVMDDIKQEMEMAQEINDAIGQPVDPLLTDDDELLEELNALEASDLETQLLAPPTKTSLDELSLPTVPDTKLPALSKEDEDLKKLEAELAGMM